MGFVIHASATKVASSTDFGFFDNLGCQTQTGRENSIALYLSDDIIDHLIKGITVWDQREHDAQQGGRHGRPHDKKCLGHHGKGALPEVRHMTSMAMRVVSACLVTFFCAYEMFVSNLLLNDVLQLSNRSFETLVTTLPHCWIQNRLFVVKDCQDVGSVDDCFACKEA